ncbi:hypothetical protein ACFL4A_02110 [bacterium]
MFNKILKIFLFAVIAFGLGACYSRTISISNEELNKIGKKIFMNECGGKIKYLTSWNKGEEFASLGVGHCIWYTKDKRMHFKESFPELLVFIKSKNIQLPEWLDKAPNVYCPWNTRQEFIQDLQSEKMQELRKFLIDTIPLQVLFMANRLEKALPKILNTVPHERRDFIEKQFYRIANSPYGMYPLIDYVNFKGEGILESERYKGKGWGLLQILERMKGTKTGINAIKEFSEIAQQLLIERVKNSPKERNEQRWLPIWKRRIQTYVEN